MKHKEKNVLLGGLAIVVVLMGLVIVEYAEIADIPFLEISPPEEEDEDKKPPTPGATEGLVTTSVAAFDSLDIATSRTVGTNVNCYWYALRGGSWVLLGSGDAADIDVQEQDSDVIYGVCSVPSGQNYYLDYQKVLSMNSRAESVEYKDIDGDNVEEFVFQINMENIPYATATGKYNMPSFNLYLLTEDTSHSLSDEANETSIGTSKVTKYIEWYTTIAAEKKAIAVSKVVLTIGTSDISKAALKKLNIPGVGYLDGSSFDQDVLTSSIKWTYTISSLLYGADYMKLPVNTLNKFEFTTALELDLATDDDIKLTLTIYYLDSSESQQSLTDDLYLQA